MIPALHGVSRGVESGTALQTFSCNGRLPGGLRRFSWEDEGLSRIVCISVC